MRTARIGARGGAGTVLPGVDVDRPEGHPGGLAPGQLDNRDGGRQRSLAERRQVVRVQIEDEVAEAVEDQCVAAAFPRLEHVSVVADDERGAGVDRRVGELTLLSGRGRVVLPSEVEDGDHEVDIACYAGDGARDQVDICAGGTGALRGREERAPDGAGAE